LFSFGNSLSNIVSCLTVAAAGSGLKPPPLGWLRRRRCARRGVDRHL
jgi:hypothetical protein